MLWALAVLLALLSPSLTEHAASAQETAVQLEVVDIVLGSLVVQPGELVRVETRIRNPAEEMREFNVVVFVDEAPQDARIVTLPPFAARTLRFNVTRAEPGAHVVRIGPKAASFQVVAPTFEVKSLSLNRRFVAAGEPATLSASVENTGASPVVYQVPLMVNNQVIDARSGFLDVGEQAALVFQVTQARPGNYVLRVGDLSTTLIAAPDDMDVAVPSSVAMNPDTTSASDGTGLPLEVTGSTMELSTSSGALEIALPIQLPPGSSLGRFHDATSGIDYDGVQLAIPIRDDLNRITASLLITPGSIAPEGAVTRLTAKTIRLVTADTLLRLPLSVTSAAPVTFVLDAPLSEVALDEALRLTPGLRPPIEAFAKVELAAQETGMTVDHVIASVSVGLPGVSLGSDPTNVTFNAPLSWLNATDQEALYIAYLSVDGGARLVSASQSDPRGGRVGLGATFEGAEGTFLLLSLSEAVQPALADLIVDKSLAPTGSAINITALVDEASSGSLPNAKVILNLNGRPIGVEPIGPLANNAIGASFSISPDNPGLYTVSTQGLEGQFEVVARDVLRRVRVTEISVTPQRAAPGENVAVKAVFHNAGPEAVLAEALLSVNGAPAQQQQLLIEADGSLETAFNLSMAKEGAYEITLLNRRRQFTVAHEPTPADIKTSELSLSPSSLDPGQPLEVRFLVQNLGETPGTHTSRIFLNGQEVDRREINVDGLTSIPITVSLMPQGEGIHTLEVEGMRRTFVVVSPLQRIEVIIETLDVAPSTVSGGEEVTVIATIRNRSQEIEAGTLLILVDDEKEIARNISVGPGKTIKQQVGIVREAPGLYEVEARLGKTEDSITSVLRKQFLVTRAQTPASWEIARLDVLPRPVLPNDPLQVSLLLSNLGQQAGELTLTAKVNNIVEWEETITLGPETTRQIAFSLPGRDPGEYVLEVNDTQVQFTVGGPAEATPTASPALPAEGASGFANPLVIALVALVVAGAALAAYLWYARRP